MCNIEFRQVRCKNWMFHWIDYANFPWSNSCMHFISVLCNRESSSHMNNCQSLQSTKGHGVIFMLLSVDNSPHMSGLQITYPYPEPVYTGWFSVHWNTTGMPLVDQVYTGTPLEKLSWNSPTLECHWRNLVESAPHWDATGETLTFTAYTGTPLDGLWQPTHAPTHIV